jgi:hypothetical protein
MVRGEGGRVGIRGNVLCTSYGSHWADVGTNPTLSANLFIINKLWRFYGQLVPHSRNWFSSLIMSDMSFRTVKHRSNKAETQLIQNQLLVRGIGVH